MKKITISAVLVLALLTQSCKKDVPVTPTCKTTTFTLEYLTDVTFTDCILRRQELQYKVGTHEIEGTGIQSIYAYSNIIRIENKLCSDLEVKDRKRHQIVQADSTYDYVGSNEFSIHFDDDLVKGTATLIVDNKKIQRTELTSSPVKFFANIPKGTVVHIVLENYALH